jgi:PAS domain S-box-containing protein
MTAELLPDTRTHREALDSVSRAPILDGLGRLYRFVLVIDASGRVLWTSDELSAHWEDIEARFGSDLRTLVSQLCGPEQARVLRSKLRERGCLARARVEVSGPDGKALNLELSVLPFSSLPEEAGLYVVIARPVDGTAFDAEASPPGASLEAAVLAGAPDAIVVIDANGYVRYANRAVAALLGHAPQMLLGRPVALLCGNARDLDGLITAVLDRKPDFSRDLVLRRHDGGSVAVAAAGRMLATAAGASPSIVLSLRDVTSSQHALAELERKNDELEQCVNTLAHDLRSPLVALLGFSRLLRQDYGERLDDTGLHFVDRIEQAGRTMETLIHDLLELSRIGQPGERRTLVDPRGVLQQLHAEIKPRLDAGGIELALPADPPLVFCDRTRLYQVFSNLIGNAVDHMGPCPEPHIRVDIVEDAEGEHITVADPGRGVAPEHHERIFEAFQTLAPRSDERRGTGIGLAIVKKIVQTHGGRVWVESQPGHGATFHVVFPRR